jgi:Domain of unknown function (DUF4126)
MEALLLALTTGWASGVNAYATVLVTGLLGRYAGFDAVPDGLQRTDVLIAAGVMFALEFVADKVPYLDSLWDAIHTIIRPVVGAIVAGLVGGNSGDLANAVYAAAGGVTALASHGVKASLRMAINTSPEPITNITASFAEDVSVAGVLTLAVAHPLAAAIIAMILLVTGTTVVVLLVRGVRRYVRERGARRRANTRWLKGQVD